MWHVLVTIFVALPGTADDADIYSLQPTIDYQTKEECEVDKAMFVEEWIIEQEQKGAMPDKWRVEAKCSTG